MGFLSVIDCEGTQLDLKYDIFCCGSERPFSIYPGDVANGLVMNMTVPTPKLG